MKTPSQILNSGFLEIRDSLDAGTVSSLQLTEAALDRAEKSQSELNSLISISREEALLQAEAADFRLKNGERGGVLGVPTIVKDLILSKGLRATAGSKILENFVAPYDATVVTRLKKSGAPLIAKANLDEFAMGSSNETSFFGAVKNPWNISKVPGGSSGGSAAAVAARIAPLSLGTDTGGSIRQPSSFSGITGLKPTYGRVSRYGVVAFASSLDQVGPMCSDAYATAAVLESIAGRDVHDATSSKRSVPAFLNETKQFIQNNKIQGLRIGVPKEYFSEGLDKEVEETVRQALSVYEKLGAKLVEISLPHTRYALPTYYLICTSEASSNLARYDGIHYGYRSPHFKGGSLDSLYSLSRGEGFGEEVRLRILLGTYALSSGYYDAYYKKASQVRTLIRCDFEKAFEICDVVAGPTSPTTAFSIGEKMGDPIRMYLADVYTLSTNLAALPGISLNCGFDSAHLPVGLQLMAPWWEESRLLGMAALFQKEKPHTLELSPVARRFEEGI